MIVVAVALIVRSGARQNAATGSAGFRGGVFGGEGKKLAGRDAGAPSES
jgi:hypothetical protein